MAQLTKALAGDLNKVFGPGEELIPPGVTWFVVLGGTEAHVSWDMERHWFKPDSFSLNWIVDHHHLFRDTYLHEMGMYVLSYSRAHILAKRLNRSIYQLVSVTPMSLVSPLIKCRAKFREIV